jgi:lipoprotein-anchoring transpeptidase ErfK/SrfK
MNSEEQNPVQLALIQGRRALDREDRQEARAWAVRALKLAPNQEEPWLLMAALACPRASIAYLSKALEINPQSKRARKGMHWAARKLRQENQKSQATIPTQPTKLYRKEQIVAPGLAMLTGNSQTGARALDQTAPSTKTSLQETKPVQLQTKKTFWVHSLAVLGFLLFFSAIAILWGFSSPKVVHALAGTPEKNMAVALEGQKASPTFTPTSTPTNTATPTNTPTPTATFTPTNTHTKTPKPTRTPTLPPPPTRPPAQPQPPQEPVADFGDANWIDINLSSQTLTFYSGKEPIRTFLVSTGTWNHPTVTGQYQIYVMYESALMTGADYYLPGVPYVMYFYRDYGIHGTYWHTNFGTPMSHGCVNMRTKDAGWVYNRVKIGTWVNIHY